MAYKFNAKLRSTGENSGTSKIGEENEIVLPPIQKLVNIMKDYDDMITGM